VRVDIDASTIDIVSLNKHNFSLMTNFLFIMVQGIIVMLIHYVRFIEIFMHLYLVAFSVIKMYLSFY